MRSCVLLLFALCATAQPAARFDVASVRPSTPEPNGVSVGFSLTGQQARLTAIPLGYYVGLAYGAKTSQISGPDTLQARFDINATIPKGVKSDQLPEMLQGLLEDRFQLKFHRETREMQVYVITAGKGRTVLRESTAAQPDASAPVTAGGTGSAQGVSADLGQGSSYSFANNQWEGTRLTIAQFAEQLEQFLDRPVVDQTNLSGHFDITLKLTPDDYQVMRLRGSLNAGFPLSPQLMQRLDGAQFPSLYDAFERLGLRLEPKKLAQPVIVVDSVLKEPTEN